MPGFHMNIFRILGDVSHIVSKFSLIWAIHSNRSAEGISLITQVLYIFVFCARYLDLFWTPPFWQWVRVWNFVVKIFYITSSMYIVFLMMRVYARTREREEAWRLGVYSLAGSLLLAIPTTAIFWGYNGFTFWENLWTFSIILESVCVLPQLLLLRQTTVPTVLDSFYLVTLGSYRFFYILNWIVRGVGREHHFDPISVIFGVVQTALYADFAWVYWTRQRVKLRGGGVVDSEDLRRGWLVSKIIGGRSGVDEEGVDEESRPALSGEDGVDGRHKPNSGVRGWGKRGISVSADEGVLEAPGRADQALADPRAFEDEESEGEGERETHAVRGELDAHSNGAEWRDDHGK